MDKIFETDWLGLNPVFYNEATKAVSYNINDVIDYNNLEFDENGLNDYLDFGYSVFGYTPIKNVRYVPPHSRLEIKETEIKVTELPDPALKYFDKTSNEDDVFDMIRENVRQWENKDEKIVIPTSAGFDSRLLNCMIGDKSKIETFGYGISCEQNTHQEVVYARELSRRLGTKYTHIPLSDFHKYNDYWFKQFGISTHLHGMYHIEFYNKIKDILGSNIRILSGIVGDLWAGKEVQPINSPYDVIHLGMNHGINANPEYCLMKRTIDRKEEYFEKNKELLTIPQYRVLALIRTKIMLLRYLMAMPMSLGMEAVSPFIDIDVCMGMLFIEPSRRRNRIWQVDFFRKNGIMIEDSPDIRHELDQNTLDLDAQNRIPLEHLDIEKMGSVFVPDYLKAINEQNNTNVEAYNAKVTLLPIQEMIKRRK